MRLRTYLTLAFLTALLLPAGPAAAAVYRCMGDDGKIKFSDRPCAEDEAESTVEIEARALAPATVINSDTDTPTDNGEPIPSEPATAAQPPINTVADLLEATRRGKALEVKTLIGRGVDVNGKDNLGFTPLHMAGLKMGTVQVARFLVEAGADVNARTRRGYSVLARSIYNLKVSTYLVENGANVNAVDNDGSNSVLHTAVKDPVTDDGVIELLIEHDANLEARNSEGETPLHVAVWRADDPLGTARLLLDRGAFVNSRNAEGETPLEVARTRSRVGVREALVKLLQSYGAR